MLQRKPRSSLGAVSVGAVIRGVATVLVLAVAIASPGFGQDTTTPEQRRGSPNNPYALSF